jgi:small subunit ribosomal protein S17
MADPQTKTEQAVSRKTKNEKVGQVVSAKMLKTIVVEVTRRVPHPVYKRIINKRKKFYAHDEQGTAKVGDVVRIIECRPLSKLKRWKLGEVIRRAVQVAVEPGAVDVESTQQTSGSKSLNKPMRRQS